MYFTNSRSSETCDIIITITTNLTEYGLRCLFYRGWIIFKRLGSF